MLTCLLANIIIIKFTTKKKYNCREREKKKEPRRQKLYKKDEWRWKKKKA